MSRRTAQDFDQELLDLYDLYDLYVHGQIARRAFFERAAKFAVSGITAASGIGYEAHIYPNVNHGFHNDTTPRYDQAAAELSWARTLG